MRVKRFSVLFILMLALHSLFSSFVFAENNVKPNIVSLGDSITYGWNLEGDNSHQSLKAFPYLIGNGKYDVAKNISGGGWTSGQLLTEISKPENLEAIKNADVITLDIGSNDFLQDPNIQTLRNNPTTPIDPVVFKGIIQGISNQLFTNLTTIIATIKAQNPDAYLIVYNIYNPFTDSLASLYPIGELFLPSVNLGIQNVAAQSGSLIADAYTAFKGNQTEYIFHGGDVHPNETGQQVLAELSTSLLAAQVPEAITVSLTPSTTEQTTEPVTITVSSVTKALAMQWIEGEKTIEDFASVDVGTDITDNKFEVTENGTYTVYVRDNKGAKTVTSIKIENISTEDPTPNPDDPGNTPDPNPGDPGNTPDPTPGDTGNNPDPTPGDTGSTPDPAPGDNGNDSNPAPVDTSSPATGDTAAESGNTLPDTASPMYNYLVSGLGLIFAGLIVLKIQNARRRENI
ncbi:GDSL-type esterase/lipase family protein [Neobacillus drentensis]|uniref:GDSL-type esterase/lipase family protein n=1 Tax=Neobacillus drentensis TaxID=220684 RepID=UPI002FFF1548